MTGPGDPDITDGNNGLDTQGGNGGGGGSPGDTGNTGMAGGGGGGYTGGGGGGDSATGGGGSGGGGSGFVAPSATTSSGENGVWNSNTGRVVISYTSGCEAAKSTDLSLALTHSQVGASDQYSLKATNNTSDQLLCVSIKVTISPIFNSDGPPKSISPAATSVSWGPLPGNQKGTISWTDLSFDASESKTFRYTLKRAQVPPVGHVTQIPADWLDWTKPGRAKAVTGTGGQLILSDTPETVKADSAGKGKAGGNIEGVLYKQGKALSPGSPDDRTGSSDGEFRFFSEHVNHSDLGAPNSRGVAKDFFIVLHNTSKHVVMIRRGITAQSTGTFEDLAGPDAELGYMRELQARGDTGCSGHGTPIRPDGTLPFAETTTPVQVGKAVFAIDDFCASPEGKDLQVGEVMVNQKDAAAFKADPLNYKFQVTGGTFRTDDPFPALTNGRGTYAHAGREVTLPDTEKYDVTKAVAFGWEIGPKDTSDPQYEDPLDGPKAFPGNYGVLYSVQVALEHGTSDTPVQVLLSPRGGAFAVGALAGSDGHQVLITAGTHSFKSRLDLLGAGQLPGTESTPFDLRIMPPAGTSLPVGVIVAPMYTMSTASAKWGAPAVTTKSDPQFVPN